MARLSDIGTERTRRAPRYGTPGEREGNWWGAVKNAYMLDTSAGQAVQFAATANAFGVPWQSMYRRVQPDYSPYDEDLTGFELYYDEFKSSTSPEETMMIKQQIENNIDLRQSLDGWGGTRLFAGLLDPVNLIPVPFALGKGFAEGAKTALKYGAPVIGGTETARHLLDRTSTIEETAFAALGGTLFMGLIGGGVGKIPKGTMTVSDALNKFIPPEGQMGMSLGVPVTGTGAAVGKSGVKGVMRKIWRTMNSEVTMGEPAWKKVDPETVRFDVDDSYGPTHLQLRVVHKETGDVMLEGISNGKTVQINAVYVDKKLQRNGYASYAVRTVVQYAEKNRLGIVSDSVMSNDAMMFWKSLDKEGYTIKENPNWEAQARGKEGEYERRSTDGEPLFEAVRLIDPDAVQIKPEVREALAELEGEATRLNMEAQVLSKVVKELKKKVKDAPTTGGARTKAKKKLKQKIKEQQDAAEEAAIMGSKAKDANVRIVMMLDKKTIKDWDLLPTGYNALLGKLNQFPWWRLLKTDLREIAPDLAVKYQMFALQMASTPGLNNKGNALSSTTGPSVESLAIEHAGAWLSASRTARSIYRKFAGHGETSGEVKHFMIDQSQRVRAVLNKYTDMDIPLTANGKMSYQEFNRQISVAISQGGKHEIAEVAQAAKGYSDALEEMGAQVKEFGISGTQQNLKRGMDAIDRRIVEFNERWKERYQVGDLDAQTARFKELNDELKALDELEADVRMAERSFLEAEREALVVDFRKNEAGAEEYFQKLRDNENLTPDEIDAIVRYNDSRGRLEIHENPELKALLESAAAKTVAEEDIVVYRGGTVEDDPAIILKNNQFVPTTLSSEWAVVMGSELGAGDVFHRIVIKRGSKHLPMKNGDAKEFEILLPPGTKLEKVSVGSKMQDDLKAEWGMESGFGSEKAKIVEWEVVPDRAILDEMDLSVAEQRASEVVNGIDEAAPTVNPRRAEIDAELAEFYARDRKPLPPELQNQRDAMELERLDLEMRNAEYVKATNPDFIHRMWLADAVVENEGVLKALLIREFTKNPIKGKQKVQLTPDRWEGGKLIEGEIKWVDNNSPAAIEARANEAYASILHEADSGNNGRFKPENNDKRPWLDARKEALLSGEAGVPQNVVEIQVELINRKLDMIKDGRPISGTSGPLLERRLDLNDKELIDLGLIEADVDTWMQHYVHRTSPMIETARVFGDARASKVIEELHGEVFMRALDAEMAGDMKLAKRLYKEAEEGAVAMNDLRDIVQGNYALNDDVDAITPRVLRMLRNFNILGAMGRSVFMALGDIGNVVMSQGFARSLGHAVEAFGAGVKDGNIAMMRGEVDLAGSVSEVILGQRYHQMTDFGVAVGSTKYPGMAKFERNLANMSQRFFLYNLLGPWTDMARRFSGGMLQSRLIENSILWKAGKLSKDEQTIMARLGINKPQAIQFADEWEASGSLKHGSMYIANTTDWISKQAVRTFRAGMNTEINRMVPTPGAVDKPKALLKGEWWKVLGQYRGFSIAATHRIMGAGIHQKGAQKYSGLASMVGIAMMVDALKRPDYIQMPLEEQLLRAVELSGVTGIVLDLNDTIERATAGSLGVRPVFGMDIRERSPNWANRMGTLGAVPNQWLTLMYGLTADEAETDDLARAIRYMIPYNNLLWWNEAFNRAQRASVDFIEDTEE